MVGAGVALLTPLLFGLAPALWAAGRHVREVLDGHAGGIVSVSRLQHGLMAAQTAIGFVLLLVAALFIHSFRTVHALDTGIDVDRLLTVRMAAPGMARAGDAGRVADAVDRIARLPGVEAVTVGGMIPFHLFRHGTFSIPGPVGPGAAAGRSSTWSGPATSARSASTSWPAGPSTSGTGPAPFPSPS